MKIFKFAIIYFLVIPISRCNEQYVEPHIVQMYENGIEKYGSFADHFPELQDGRYHGIGGDNIYKNNYNRFYVTMRMSGLEARQITKNVRRQAIAAYPMSAPCLRLINHTYLREGERRLTDFCDDPNMLPVPDMSIADNGYIPDKFFTEGIIYVLEAEKGEFLDKKYLSEEGIGLSDWEHGYSKGVTIYKRYMSFWVYIW